MKWKQSVYQSKFLTSSERLVLITLIEEVAHGSSIAATEFTKDVKGSSVHFVMRSNGPRKKLEQKIAWRNAW